MNLDSHGLPCQADGDRNDQLQRVGMIIAGRALEGDILAVPGEVQIACLRAVDLGGLQILPGVFTRCVGVNPNNCSADQLISVLGAAVASGDAFNVREMFLSMMFRWGFAQNTRDGLNDNPNWKIPDFMALRAMPLFSRFNWATWLFAWLFDFYLVILVISDWVYFHADNDPADINDTVLTLAVCRLHRPTFISMFASWLWPRLRPSIYLWLQRYHRAESGGNPEIALMWKPICDRLWG